MAKEIGPNFWQSRFRITPPLSAFFVRNKKENITLHSNLEFSVNFGGNSAAVKTAGPISLKTAFEEYTMDKMTPDMNIQRVVYGVKYFMWEGEFSVECKATGYKGTFVLHEENETTNSLTGRVSHKDKLLYHLHGITGSVISIWKPDGEANKQPFYDGGNQTPPDIKYPPKECRVAMDSLRLWSPVAVPIIANDMEAADAAKKVIEQSQRVRERAREAAGEDYNAKFFKPIKVDGKIVSWVFNTDRTVDQAFLDAAAKQAKEEDAQREIEEAQEAERKEEEAIRRQAEAANQAQAESEDNCTIN